VRPASVEDIDGLLDLLEEVASEGRWIAAETPIDREARGRGLRRRVEDDDADVLVAEVAGTSAGYLGIDNVRGLLEIGMLVSPRYRRRGVGTSLMNELLRWARAHDAHKITLQLWPHNEAARALYVRFGFIREGYLERHWKRRSGQLWDSEIMSLRLDRN
jgi:RimJ/RimL family protein N-acetyltransferase